MGLGLLSLACGGMNKSMAAPWEWESRVQSSAEYNNNPLLSVTDKKGVTGIGLDGEVTLRRADPTLNIEFAPRLRRHQYEGGGQLDSTEQFIELLVDKLYSRSAVSLNSYYNRDTTLTGEFESTGIVQVNKRRETYAVSPSFSYEMSPYLLFQLNPSYTQVQYTDATNTGLYDYTYKTVALSLVREITPKDRLSGSVSNSILDAQSIGMQTDNLGMQLTYNHELSEVTRLNVGAGWRATTNWRDLGYTTEEQSDDGWLFDLGYEQEMRRSVINLSFSRRVQPSGLGRLQQEEMVKLSLRHSIDTLLSSNLLIQWARLGELGTGTTSRALERDYLLTEFSLNRALTPEMSIGGSYRYYWQKQSGSSSVSADADVVYLTLSYRSKPN